MRPWAVQKKDYKADAVSIPVIAAGGIGDGRGLAAAFALGAEGVLMVTRFLVSWECPIHDSYKEALVKAGDTDTVNASFPDFSVRLLKNRRAHQNLFTGQGDR